MEAATDSPEGIDVERVGAWFATNIEGAELAARGLPQGYKGTKFHRVVSSCSFLILFPFFFSTAHIVNSSLSYTCTHKSPAEYH